MPTVHVHRIKAASSRLRSSKLRSKGTPIGGAVCHAGKVGHYVDPRVNFEGTELRAAVVSQFALRRFHSRTQNDSQSGGIHSLDCVGFADRYPSSGIGLDNRSDVTWGDFFFAAVNDLLKPSSHKEIA